MRVLAERIIEEQKIKTSLEHELLETKSSKSSLELELSEIKSSKAWKTILYFRRLHIMPARINSHRDQIWRRFLDSVFTLFGIIRQKPK